MGDLDEKNGKGEPGFSGEDTRPSASDEPTGDGFEIVRRERTPIMILSDIGTFVCEQLEDEDILAFKIKDFTRRHISLVLNNPDKVGLINFPPSNMLLYPNADGLRTDVKIEGKDWGATNFSIVNMDKLLGAHYFDDKMLVVISDVLKAVDRVIEGRGLDEKFDVDVRVTRDLRARGRLAGVPRLELQLEQKGLKNN